MIDDLLPFEIRNAIEHIPFETATYVSGRWESDLKSKHRFESRAEIIAHGLEASGSVIGKRVNELLSFALQHGGMEERAHFLARRLMLDSLPLLDERPLSDQASNRDTALQGVLQDFMFMSFTVAPGESSVGFDAFLQQRLPNGPQTLAQRLFRVSSYEARLMLRAVNTFCEDHLDSDAQNDLSIQPEFRGHINRLLVDLKQGLDDALDRERQLCFVLYQNDRRLTAEGYPPDFLTRPNPELAGILVDAGFDPTPPAIATTMDMMR